MTVPRAVAASAMAMAVAVAVLTGCQDRGDHPEVVTSPVGCQVPKFDAVDAASVLRPGPTNGLPASDAPGESLVIDAVVLDAGCRPAAGASLRIWHTDAHGDYRPAGTDACCYYQGTVRTDRNGRFRLETIRPGQYNEANAPPAHIHLELGHDSARLTTQIVFTTGTASAARVLSAEIVTVVLSKDGDTWRGTAAFVLPS